MALRQKLALAALVSLTALAIYGFYHQKLFAEPLLSPAGRHHLVQYFRGFLIGAVVLLWLAPRWLGALAAAFVLIYTFWWSGLAAPLAALYFIGACLLTGKILVRRSDAAAATVLGLAVWISAIWAALHFPVNTRPIYLGVFALPYLWESRRLRDHLRGFRIFCSSRSEAAPLAILLFLLLAHWLLALKPETSADGRSVHLTLAAKVDQEARWKFDFQHETWALMPAGGDCAFTAAYVLAGESNGEAAVKLTNFALFLLIVAMIVQTSRRWLPLGHSLLVGALFASTPLVELVTGSVFVENVWAALILGGTLALLRYDESERSSSDLQIAGVLFGTALAVKVGAAAFLAPAVAVALTITLRKKNLRALLPFAGWIVLLGAPTYLYAYLRSGNPLFPTANTLFRSPYFDSTTPFRDPRFAIPLSWHIPFDLTFRSNLFFEGLPGASGFQYFLLLLPAVFLIRKREQWLILTMGAGGGLLILAVLPNLRYFYPAMPLLSIAIGVLLVRWPRFSAAFTLAFILLAVLNFGFLSSASWYHRDFALFSRKQAAAYFLDGAPEAALIQRMNREAPGEPVAFFETEAVTGLHGPAYADSWHYTGYSTKLGTARNSAEIAQILRDLSIRHIIAPASRKAEFPTRGAFLRDWMDADGAANGTFALFRLRDAPQPPAPPPPPPLPSALFSAGSWDDLDPRILYVGTWLHDHNSSFSEKPGDSLRFSFSGTGITYVFRETQNSGVARILIDSNEVAKIDQYSPQSNANASRDFGGLKGGPHTFEVKALDTRNPRSSGKRVALDGFTVRP